MKLQDLGISRDHSSRWQQAAQLPDSAFETYLDTTRQQGKEITSTAVLKLARTHLKQAAQAQRYTGVAVVQLLNLLSTWLQLPR